VSIEEIEARLRQVVAEASQPVQQVVARSRQRRRPRRARRMVAHPPACLGSGCGGSGAGEVNL
jgi:hypothetical protein